MKIFRTIDKLLAGLGNMKAMRRTHVDTYTEDKMSQVLGEKIAVIDKGGVWIEFQELAGFMFMNITILSNENIKTYRGCALSFLGGEKVLCINSDTTAIESDYSNVSNRWMTKISFVVSKEERKLITKKEYKIVKVDFKKTSIQFSTV